MNKISVVIPTYNRLNTLKLVLTSYLNQKFVHEIIVIDDFSSDGTSRFIKEIAAGNNKLKYYRNKRNMGAPYSRNRAISLSTGNLIYMGEDDLELTDNYFDKIINHMVKSGADVIAGRRIWMQFNESKEQSLYRANKVTDSPVNRKILLTNCEVDFKKDTELPLVDASMLINKKVFSTVRYDEFYSKNAWREETDFQISALERGFKIMFCPHVISYHLYKERNTGGNHSHSIYIYELRIFLNNMYMVKKHWKYLNKEFGINWLIYIRFLYYRISRIVFSKLVFFKKTLVG